MDIAKKILMLLEQSGGRAVTVKQMALVLGVSTENIQKSIEQLKSKGVKIENVGDNSFCLEPFNAPLQAETIKRYIKKPLATVEVYSTISSTNARVKQLIKEDAHTGSMVAAASQTKGVGRREKAFESPIGGLYMSILLKLDSQNGQNLPDTMLATAGAAIAVCNAVQQLCYMDLGIKWMNDLYFNHKKCAGILAQTVPNPRTGHIEYMIIGIGLNYETPLSAFSSNVKDEVTSLYPDEKIKPPVSISRLIGQIHKNLMTMFEELPKKEFLQAYKEKSIILDKEIYVQSGKDSYKAIALDIDDKARLVVETQTGERKSLVAGDVSIRKVNIEQEAQLEEL